MMAVDQNIYFFTLPSMSNFSLSFGGINISRSDSAE